MFKETLKVQIYFTIHPSLADTAIMQGIKSLYGAGAAFDPLDSACLNPTVVVLIWKKKEKKWIKAEKNKATG